MRQNTITGKPVKFYLKNKLIPAQPLLRVCGTSLRCHGSLPQPFAYTLTPDAGDAVTMLPARVNAVPFRDAD